MNVLVTGGAGFIGSALVRRLLGDGELVINVDKLTYAGDLSRLGRAAESSRHLFEKVDITEREALDRIFATHRPSHVYHLAAESHVDRSIDGPNAFVSTNVVGTCTLLESARGYWSSLTGTDREHFRFLHVSTDEVFGSLGATGAFCETTAYDPSSPYSSTKAAADHLVRAWHRTYGLPVLISNCSNNYGPYQFPEKLIPLMVCKALRGEALPVYGDGNQVRDWLYIRDHVNALVAVMDRGEVGESYNIGGSSERSNIDVVRLICDLLEKLHPETSFNGRYEDLIAHVADRPGHDVRYAMDTTKIRKSLGWRPLETFESGLEKTVRWALANQHWYDAIRASRYEGNRLGSARIASRRHV